MISQGSVPRNLVWMDSDVEFCFNCKLTIKETYFYYPTYDECGDLDKVYCCPECYIEGESKNKKEGKPVTARKTVTALDRFYTLTNLLKLKDPSAAEQQEIGDLSQSLTAILFSARTEIERMKEIISSTTSAIEEAAIALDQAYTEVTTDDEDALALPKYKKDPDLPPIAQHG